jgi:hypothetical protein
MRACICAFPAVHVDRGGTCIYTRDAGLGVGGRDLRGFQDARPRGRYVGTFCAYMLHVGGLTAYLLHVDGCALECLVSDFSLPGCGAALTPCAPACMCTIRTTTRGTAVVAAGLATTTTTTASLATDTGND